MSMSSFFTIGPRLCGNELTPSETTRLLICLLCQAVSLCYSHSSSMQACGQQAWRKKTNITFSCCCFMFLNWVFSLAGLHSRNISYIAAPIGRMRYSNCEFCHSPSRAGFGLNQRTELTYLCVLLTEIKTPHTNIERFLAIYGHITLSFF